MRRSDGEVVLEWPLLNHIITAGWTYNDGSAHRALDFRAVVGTPVYASESGTVDQVQYWNGKSKTGMQSYGNMVRIRHSPYKGKNLQTRYAHLKTILVKNGQTVNEGDLIGYSGETGNCYGEHLHYEVIYNGVRVNPLSWLDKNFTTANASVAKHLGSYQSVEREKESAPSSGDYIKIHATGSDMAKLLELCNSLKLTYTRSES